MSTSGKKESQSDGVEPRPVKLRILDKEVQLACKPDEENDLLKAAQHVDKSMRELRARNSSSSIEKIAIVVAINTANALLQSQSGDKSDKKVANQLASINAKLEALLEA